MSLFSPISNLYSGNSDDSLQDDNIAQSAADNNPYISAAVLAMRNAYDTMYSVLSPMVTGKEKSLKQIDKWLEDWMSTLNKILVMYQELLNKLDDLGTSITEEFTLDFAKDAWQIIQDTPILRRYMGEANYWYLYDTLGLLSTQSGSLTDDAVAAIKECIKSVIYGLLAMTDGLMNLESNLGMIQQYWGALYLKAIPLPLLDSIVPNVTCAYYYKKPIPGTVGSVPIQNDVPGEGFSPVPAPIPDPVLLARYPEQITKLDYQNPDTWYVDTDNGKVPYYIPNTMTLLYRALAYWGSSYTDEYVPLVNRQFGMGIYERRKYGDGPHPLRVGRTFEQLDTGYSSVTGNNLGTGKSLTEILAGTFTDEMIPYMDAWQEHYEAMRILAAGFLKSKGVSDLADFYTFTGSGYIPVPDPTGLDCHNNPIPGGQTLAESFRYWAGEPITGINTQTPEGYAQAYAQINPEYHGHLRELGEAIKGMVRVYLSTHPDMDGSAAQTAFQREVLDVLAQADRASGILTGKSLYTIGPNPTLGTFYTSGGLHYAAYSLNPDDGVIDQYLGIDYATANVVATGSPGGISYCTYSVSRSFVMFPDARADNKYEYSFTRVQQDARSFSAYMTGLSSSNGVVGTVGNALVYTADKPIVAGDPSSIPPVAGTLTEVLTDTFIWAGSSFRDIGDGTTYFTCLLFPDGSVPQDMESLSVIPDTFVTKYRAAARLAAEGLEELADEVGYSILKGRETKFPCFGIYGELLGMHSWDYREMPLTQFKSGYTKVTAGSDLYYENANPSHVVYKYGQYMSSSLSIMMAIYHEPLTHQTITRGSESYTFYIYPCESVSVSVLPGDTGTLAGNVSYGNLLSEDATGPDGIGYHYNTMRNPIPKCARYVDPEKWSFMDILHEMYQLAYWLAPLCTDNGERLNRLEELMSGFGVSQFQTVYQLPRNNGEYTSFRFNIFNEYAERIRIIVDSIYGLKESILDATRAW